MKHLKVLRLKAGYKTVKYAAEQLGISPQMLYHMEEGVKKPSIKIAAKMIEIYGCNLDDIFLPYITTVSCKTV
jgi:DNA-binding XRE family transcriptional regulator